MATERGNLPPLHPIYERLFQVLAKQKAAERLDRPPLSKDHVSPRREYMRERRNSEAQREERRLRRRVEKLVREHSIDAVSNVLQQLIDSGYAPPSTQEEARIKEEGFTISQASREAGMPATVLVEWSEKGLIPILKKADAPGYPTYLDKGVVKEAGVIYHRAKAQHRQPIKMFQEELKAKARLEGTAPENPIPNRPCSTRRRKSP
jgi:hypothetical protein